MNYFFEMLNSSISHLSNDCAFVDYLPGEKFNYCNGKCQPHVINEMTKEPDTETRPATRLHQSRVLWQGPYLRSLDHKGRSSEAKDCKNPKKEKCDGLTNGRTDGRTNKAGCRVA